LGDGTANVGLGTLSAKGTPPKLDHRAMMRDWLAHSAQDWEFGEIEGDIKGAAIPMAFNRQPHYVPGMMLVGDSGGMVNPFNGEGIAYAMQAARRATEAAVAWRSATGVRDQEAALASYARMMKDDLGGYYSLGRVFAALVEHPAVMKAIARGTGFLVLWSWNSRLDCWQMYYEPRGGTWADKLLSALTPGRPGSMTASANSSRTEGRL